MLLLEVLKNHRWPQSILSYSRQEILLASSIKPIPKRLLDNGYEVVEAKEEDINAFIDMRREEEEEYEEEGLAEQCQNKFNKILNFINSGNSLYLVYDKSKVIGYLYLYRGKRELQFSDSISNKIFMSCGDKISFFGFGYVALKYRMKGIFPLMMNHAVKSNPSVEMFFSDISPLNTISINSHRRIGFSVIGNIKLFRVLSIFPMWLINLNNQTSYKFSKHINISVDSFVDNKSS